MLRGNSILNKAARVNIRVKFTTTSYFLPNHVKLVAPPMVYISGKGMRHYTTKAWDGRPNGAIATAVGNAVRCPVRLVRTKSSRRFSSTSKGEGEGSLKEKGEAILDKLELFSKESDANKTHMFFNLLIKHYTNTDCEMALSSQKVKFEVIMDQMRCAHAREVSERNQRQVIEWFFLDIVAIVKSLTNMQDKNPTARTEAEALIEKIKTHIGESDYLSLLRPHPPMGTINRLMTSPLGPHFMSKMGHPRVKFPRLDATRFLCGQLSEAEHCPYITEVPLPVNTPRDMVAFFEALASRRSYSVVWYNDIEADNGERYLSMSGTPTFMTQLLLKQYSKDALVGLGAGQREKPEDADGAEYNNADNGEKK